MRLLDALDANGVPLKDFVAVMCARNPQHALVPLLDVLDDEQFVMFVEKFRGMYCRAPAVKSLAAACFELGLLTKHREYRRAVRHGNLDEIRTARRRLDAHWEKMVENRIVQRTKDRPVITSEERAAEIEAELKDARSWFAAHEGGPAWDQARLELAVEEDVEAQDAGDVAPQEEAGTPPPPILPSPPDPVTMIRPKDCSKCSTMFDAGAGPRPRKYCDACRYDR